jgi:site-specific recombinase XerD
VTLDRPDLSRRLVLVRHPRKLPNVLSVEEVGRLLEAAPGLVHSGSAASLMHDPKVAASYLGGH